MVYKATLNKRVGIEVFATEKTLKPEEPCHVVAVKELQGNCNHHGKSCIKGRIVTLCHPCSFTVYHFFYLIKLLFPSFLPCKSNFVCGQNNSKYRD